MTVAARIAAERARLTPAERRVAEVVEGDPSAVAFGTVATLARQSGTSGPTVVRLATRLGFEGFGELQSAVQSELAAQLRPAAERIRHHPAGSLMARALELETTNVRRTLEAMASDALDLAVEVLADRRRPLHVLAGQSTAGVAGTIADALDLLRGDVIHLTGPDVAVQRRLATDPPGAVLAIELRRYERWVLDAAESAGASGCRLVAITDARTSPLARRATVAFPVSAAGPGPFDSHVGVLTVGNVLVAGVARRLRRSATARLDAVEEAWSRTGVLVEGPVHR